MLALALVPADGGVREAEPPGGARVRLAAGGAAGAVRGARAAPRQRRPRQGRVSTENHHTCGDKT